jgi:hypothetical protein
MESESSNPQVSPLKSHIGFWLRFVSNHISLSFAGRLESSGVTSFALPILIGTTQLTREGEIHIKHNTSADDNYWTASIHWPERSASAEWADRAFSRIEKVCLVERT